MTLFNLFGGVRSWCLLAAGTLALGVILNAAVSRRTALRSAEGVDPESRRTRNLEETLRTLMVRIKVKVHIVDEVLAGRMPFLQAAASFRALDRMPPIPPVADGPELFRGSSEEERCCRAVILWVRKTLDRSDPCLSAITCAQLEDQLSEHLRHGPLRLPEIDPGALLPVGASA